MFISLKYIKILKGTPTCFDLNRSSSGSRSVRGDPCGAVQSTAPQGSPRTPATCIAATTPELIVEILDSVFFKFFKF